jgi:hypothetical protein
VIDGQVMGKIAVADLLPKRPDFNKITPSP